MYIYLYLSAVAVANCSKAKVLRGDSVHISTLKKLKPSCCCCIGFYLYGGWKMKIVCVEINNSIKLERREGEVKGMSFPLGF